MEHELREKQRMLSHLTKQQMKDLIKVFDLGKTKDLTRYQLSTMIEESTVAPKELEPFFRVQIAKIRVRRPRRTLTAVQMVYNPDTDRMEEKEVDA